MSWLVLLATVSMALTALRWVRPMRGRRRDARLQTLGHARGLPSVVVLLQIAMAGGSHPRHALSTVAELATVEGALGTVASDLARVRDGLSLGADLTSVMLATDVRSIELHRVLDALRRAEIDGGPLGSHLDVLLIELRRHRRTALDASAQRLTVSMLFPLVVCILPAFVLLAVVPLVHAALGGLAG